MDMQGAVEGKVGSMPAMFYDLGDSTLMRKNVAAGSERCVCVLAIT
jgi:hypothetical protein